MPRILIVFGTTDGHTARIASAIGDAVSDAGDTASVFALPMEVPDPGRYDAVIVAASVHRGLFQRPVAKWVLAHAQRLNAMPTAFVSVSLGILQHDPAVRAEVESIVTRFLDGTGWRPTARLGVAGALLYTHYSWLTRLVMRRIARKAGGDTDTTRDYVYTDWAALRHFVDGFARRVEAAVEVRAPALV